LTSFGTILLNFSGPPPLNANDNAARPHDEFR
jgi:hypothetical protein